MVKIALALCLTFVAATAAVAQTALPQGQPQAARSQVSAEDFRRLALIGESFDLESSKLAYERATRNSIRRYAAFLISNFRLNYGRLSAGAGVFSGIPTLPGDPNAAMTPFLDPRRQLMLNQLTGAQGRVFDRLYVDMQLGMRQELIALYETFLQSGGQSGGNAQLMAYAQARLPALAQEQRAIRRLAGR